MHSSITLSPEAAHLRASQVPTFLSPDTVQQAVGWRSRA